MCGLLLLSGKSRGKAFDSMNGIAANMLLHLTSSVRFEGALNVDLNEITTNLVPFPRLHFLLASLSPLAAPRDMGKLLGAPRAVDQVRHHVVSGTTVGMLSELGKHHMI